MSDKIFADGVYITRKDNAPDFVIASVGVNVDKFIKQLQELRNERGYVNYQILKNKNDNGYHMSVDTWQPQQQSQSAPAQSEPTPPPVPDGEFNDDIPF